MRTLDRYIIRGFLHSYLLCLVVMVGLRLAGDLFVNIDEFAELGDVGSSALARHLIGYYAAHSVVYFQELSGVILVAAAAFSLARMNHANELTAVLASGTSIHRVVLPVVLTAMALAGLGALNQELLIPRIKDRLAMDRDEHPETVHLSVHLLQDDRGQIWFSEDYQGYRQCMVQPMILARDARKGLAARISGDQAFYNGPGLWRLTEAVVVRPRPDQATITTGFLPAPGALTLLEAVAVSARAADGELTLQAGSAETYAGLLRDVQADVFGEQEQAIDQTPLVTLRAPLAALGRRGNEPGFYLLGPPELSPEQIRDLPGLCRRLTSAAEQAHPNSFARRLWDRLGEPVRRRALLLGEGPPTATPSSDKARVESGGQTPPPGDPDAVALAQALTAALRARGLLGPAELPLALLEQPARAEAWAALPAEDVYCLNRLALDLLAPGLIVPSQAELWVHTDLTPEEVALRRHGDWVELMSTPEINRLLATGKAPDPSAAELVKHLRAAGPAINLVMMLVGVPFILSRQRNIKASATLCTAMAVLVYVTALLSRQLCGAGVLDPVLAAWGPVLIFGPTAVGMLDAVKT